MIHTSLHKRKQRQTRRPSRAMAGALSLDHASACTKLQSVHELTKSRQVSKKRCPLFVPRKSAHCADWKADEKQKKIHTGDSQAPALKEIALGRVDSKSKPGCWRLTSTSPRIPRRCKLTGHRGSKKFSTTETSPRCVKRPWKRRAGTRRQVAIKRNSRHKNSCLLPRVGHSWCATILHRREPICQMPMGERLSKDTSRETSHRHKKFKRREPICQMPMGREVEQGHLTRDNHRHKKFKRREPICQMPMGERLSKDTSRETSHRHKKFKDGNGCVGYIAVLPP
ncbi:hypothetical protein BDZ89DRAFT_1034675 [Hymenopellis radicata]|nr:hypothetical protein BDZ89DRAFT_1034675 [Hymenopellis radicata]